MSTLLQKLRWWTQQVTTLIRGAVFHAQPRHYPVKVIPIRGNLAYEWQVGHVAFGPLHTWMMNQEDGKGKKTCIESCHKLTDDSLEEGELRTTDSDLTTQNSSQSSKSDDSATRHKHNNRSRKNHNKRSVQEYSTCAAVSDCMFTVSTLSSEKKVSKKKRKKKPKEEDHTHELKRFKSADNKEHDQRGTSPSHSRRHKTSRRRSRSRNKKDLITTSTSKIVVVNKNSPRSRRKDSDQTLKNEAVVIIDPQKAVPAISFLKCLNAHEGSTEHTKSSKDILNIPLPDAPLPPVEKETDSRGSPATNVLPSNSVMDPNAAEFVSSQQLQTLQAQALQYAQRNTTHSQPGRLPPTSHGVAQHNQLQSMFEVFTWPSLQPPPPIETTVDQAAMPCAWTCEQATQYLQNTEQAQSNGPPVIDNNLKMGKSQSPSSRGEGGQNPSRGQRHWDSVNREHCSGGMEFSVMSYNILSQSLMEMHPYLYNNLMAWQDRGPALCAEILSHFPDVVCLQEVEEEHWKLALKPSFEAAGYGCVYKKKTGDKVDGCAILYNLSKFELGKAVPVEYDRGGILDRDNVGLVVSLRPRADSYSGTSRQLCVATTHLLFNPRRGDVKLAQLSLLLAEIDQWAYRPGEDNDQHSNYNPVILCGDFNSEPNSPLVRLMTTGKLQYSRCLSRLVSGQQEGLYSGRDVPVPQALLPTRLGITEGCQYRRLVVDRWRRRNTDKGPRGSQSPLPSCAMNTGWMSHHLNLASVYKHKVGKQMVVTTQHARASCMVDYIFYTSSLPQRRGKRRRTDTDKDAEQHSSKSPNADKRRTFSDEDSLTSESESRVSERPSSSPGRHTPSCGSDMELCSDDSNTCKDSRDNIDDSVTPPPLSPIPPPPLPNREEADNQGSLVLLSRYRLPCGRDLGAVGHMPNKVFPSDHVCLLARFLLR